MLQVQPDFSMGADVGNISGEIILHCFKTILLTHADICLMDTVNMSFLHDAI